MSNRFPLIGATEFASDTYRPEWLVKGCFVRHEPAVIAGPSKSLKTSLLVDLAVSLASATPFLGKFEVPHARTVALLSGESGRSTLAETAARVCAARNVQLADLEGRFHVGLHLPTLSDELAMKDFADALLEVGGAEVVIIDPLYLCLGDVDAKNLFAVGAALRTANDALSRQGSMLILAHHANKGLAVGGPMELRHLSHTGLEQFARQIGLLNRRSPYRQDGQHRLWLRLGGSAGHGGLWALDVEEGVNAEEFGRREWRVRVETAEAAESDDLTAGDRAKHARAGREMHATRQAVLEVIDAAKAAGEDGASFSAIRDACPAFKTKALREFLREMIESGQLKRKAFVKRFGQGAKRKLIGYTHGDGPGWPEDEWRQGLPPLDPLAFVG